MSHGGGDGGGNGGRMLFCFPGLQWLVPPKGRSNSPMAYGCTLGSNGLLSFSDSTEEVLLHNFLSAQFARQ